VLAWEIERTQKVRDSGSAGCSVEDGRLSDAGGRGTRLGLAISSGVPRPRQAGVDASRPPPPQRPPLAAPRTSCDSHAARTPCVWVGSWAVTVVPGGLRASLLTSVASRGTAPVR